MSSNGPKAIFPFINNKIHKHTPGGISFASIQQGIKIS
jgi:hypothetical protein